METIRLTMAQATVKWLINQYTEIDGEEVPVFAGAFGIFGHGNVTSFAEALEPGRAPIEARHPCGALGHRQAHPATKLGALGDRRGQPFADAEAVDGLHQVERSAKHPHVALRRDQARVRNVRVSERTQNPGLAAHRLIRVLPLVLRWPPQHIGAASAIKLQQQILGAARKRFDRAERAFPQPTGIHPLEQNTEVDDRRIDRLPVSHSQRSPTCRHQDG